MVCIILWARNSTFGTPPTQLDIDTENRSRNITLNSKNAVHSELVIVCVHGHGSSVMKKDSHGHGQSLSKLGSSLNCRAPRQSEAL